MWFKNRGVTSIKLLISISPFDLTSSVHNLPGSFFAIVSIVIKIDKSDTVLDKQQLTLKFQHVFDWKKCFKSISSSSLLLIGFCRHFFFVFHSCSNQIIISQLMHYVIRQKNDSTKQKQCNAFCALLSIYSYNRKVLV